ncbi:Guanosine-diphosphatase [Nowakowskiella sp. JEL0078]|nr:Guanosine-diphosphatase [Nowakowskiella sp. JEL0078]
MKFFYSEQSSIPFSSQSKLKWDPTPFALAPPPCKSSKFGRPVRQFAIMVDAGSTGSRIHVYRFNFCEGKLPTLEDEAFKQITPGLSSYTDDHLAAAKSLDVLLDEGLRNIPEELRGCTPIAIKATAGLRLLGAGKSEAILQEVESRVRTKYPFRIVKKDGVVVMDGKDEGVFAWITVNYLLGTLLKPERVPTAGIMDLGGASTQIVFEPETNSEILEGDHKYLLNFGGRQYTLFQHSYLRYGLMESRRRIKEYLIDIFSKIPHTRTPCHGSHFSEDIMHTNGNSISLQGEGADFNSCHKIVTSSLFDKSSTECLRIPCSFDGVYQPLLTETFKNNDIYIFSYFYDRTEPLGLLSVSVDDEKASGFPVGAIKDAARIICSKTELKDSWISPEIQNILTELSKETIERLTKKNPDYCLDLTFIYALLNTGYAIPDQREVRLAKKIKNVETGWCLGAAIHIVDEMFSEEGNAAAICKIKELK